jgi:hypothetical protein
MTMVMAMVMKKMTMRQNTTMMITNMVMIIAKTMKGE